MTVYPDALDTDLELPRVDSNITEMGGDAINALRGATFAIESALGLNPQGNAPSLAARINGVIDENGRIRTTALAGIGLVTLPIDNNQISLTAAIDETKLNLDFTTSFLKGRIDSVSTDLTALQNSFNGFASDVFKHYNGTLNRHDGYAIDLQASVQTETTVEGGLHAVDNLLVDHLNSSTAHDANEITTNGVFNSVTVTNVQQALDALNSPDARIVQHRDESHDTAVSLNERGEQGAQGNLRNTTFASTIYQTITTNPTTPTNILQVMRPNVARISGLQPDLRALNGTSAFILRFTAGGVGRGAISVILSPAIPTESLDDVVELINLRMTQNFYPVSAYNVDGRLVLAHNIPGAQYTLTINSITNSAHAALGFGDIEDTTFVGLDEDDAYHSALVGGNKISAIKSLIKEPNHSHGGTATVSPGLGDLNLLGIPTTLEGRILCNITEHSAGDAYNGTYYIEDFPTNDTFTLHTSVPAGNFLLEVPGNAVNFLDVARGEIWDIFLENDADGYGFVTKSLRMDYLTNAGVDIKGISRDFPTSGIQWEVDSNQAIKLYENGVAGESVSIPNGFLGELKVYGRDGVSSMLFEVQGTPSSGIKNITVNAFAGTNDRLHLSSVHHAGNFAPEILKYALDKRKLGGTPINEYTNRLEQLPLDDSLKELRNNGVIRGFEVDADGYTANSFTVVGGRALSDGRILDIETRTITIDSFNNGIRLLALDRFGNYQTYDADEAGYAVEELTAGDSYGDHVGLVPIAEFNTSASALNGVFNDRRLFVNKLDKRVKDNFDTLSGRISQVESTFAGSAWGNTLTASTEAPDAYTANITVSGGGSVVALDEPGFSGGNALITTRRYTLTTATTTVASTFIPTGMTHINVMMRLDYTGTSTDGPFGVSGPVTIQLGLAATTGIVTTTTTEAYATVRNIETTIFPVDNVREHYVASIPIADLNLTTNTFVDFSTRIKIFGSTFIDGGTVPIDTSPIIYFSKVRLVSSSYSIAGTALNQDGSSTALGALIGEVL